MRTKPRSEVSVWALACVQGEACPRRPPRHWASAPGGRAGSPFVSSLAPSAAPSHPRRDRRRPASCAGPQPAARAGAGAGLGRLEGAGGVNGLLLGDGTGQDGPPHPLGEQATRRRGGGHLLWGEVGPARAGSERPGMATTDAGIHREVAHPERVFIADSSGQQPSPWRTGPRRRPSRSRTPTRPR